MTNNITQLMNTLRSEATRSEVKHGSTSSLMHPVQVTIPTNLFKELKVMSSEYGIEYHDLAGELLTIALRDAVNVIPEDEHDRLREIRESFEKDQARQLMTKAQYNAGGT